MGYRISRSEILSSVPIKKLRDAQEQTVLNCEECVTNKAKLHDCCNKCRVINNTLARYAESNIPVKYWKLDMERDFQGDPALLNAYRSVTESIKKSYDNGTCVIFAGNHGSGKTMVVTNILKRAVEKGYSSLYTTLSSIVSSIISPEGDDKSIARKELLTVDFLVIDEFDPRFMASDNASDLYGRTLEDTFRTRAQNNLPTFMCTNSPNVTESFTGAIKQSISSLMNYANKVTVISKDFRKEGK